MELRLLPLKTHPKETLLQLFPLTPQTVRRGCRHQRSDSPRSSSLAGHLPQKHREVDGTRDEEEEVLPAETQRKARVGAEGMGD